ncbi:MAG: hypothetical protein KDB26_08395 [Microthrixaceae bacterium]|nr:hypothetical protein [Microthrixaceae bacterium]
MRKLWWVLLGIAVMALAVWLNEIPANARPMSSSEQSYIEAVREGDTNHTLTDADWLYLGYQSCAAVQTAGSPNKAMTLLAVTTEYPLRVLSGVMDAATEYLCDEKGRVK